jgi:hypothetical protein
MFTDLNKRADFNYELFAKECENMDKLYGLITCG